MQRLVLILLLLIMPTQWVWASAASVCQHETSSSTSHIGHHEHEHEPPLLKPQAELGDTQQQAGLDTDCLSCHGTISAPVMDAALALNEGRRPPGATPYQRAITQGVPDRLIRPPHSQLA